MNRALQIWFFFFLPEVNCTLLKERLPLRTPEGLTSRTWLEKVVEAKTLAYCIGPHNNFVYRF